MIGTICSWFFPEHITAHFMWGVIMCAVLAMIFIFVWFVTRCVRLSLPNATATVAVTLLYAVGPFSLIGYLQEHLAVYFIETYQIILTLIWLLAFMKFRGKWHYYVITLVISVTACLIHHTFCCVLFPLFVALFLYDILEDGYIDWRKAISYSSICAALFALLVIIWTQSHMNVDIETLSAHIGNRVAPDAYYRWENTDSALYILFYATNSFNRELAFNLFNETNLYIELVLTILVLLPFIFLFWHPWFIAAKRSKEVISKWRYRLVPIVISIMTLPIFFMATDYSRWFVGYFFSLFAVIMAALALGDKQISQAWKDILSYFKCQPWVALILIVFAIQLHMNFSCGLDLAIRIRKMAFMLFGIDTDNDFVSV